MRKILVVSIILFTFVSFGCLEDEPATVRVLDAHTIEIYNKLNVPLRIKEISYNAASIADDGQTWERKSEIGIIRKDFLVDSMTYEHRDIVYIPPRSKLVGYASNTRIYLKHNISDIWNGFHIIGDITFEIPTDSSHITDTAQSLYMGYAYYFQNGSKIGHASFSFRSGDFFT